MRIIEHLLAITIFAAVLSFGGVEVATFSLVEIAVAALAVLAFWRTDRLGLPRRGTYVLAVILAVPIIQCIPLPRFVLGVVSPARVRLAEQLVNIGTPLPSALPVTVSTDLTLLRFLLLICYVAVFLMAFQFYRQRGRSILGYALVALAIFEAAYGIVQYLADWQYIFTYKKQYYTDVATGTYINRNHFAGLLAMAVPFPLAAIVSRGQQSGARWFASAATSLFLRDAVLLAVLWLGIVASQSRMGTAAALAGTACVVMISFLRGRRRAVVAVALLAVAIAGVYAAWVGVDPLLRRFDLLAQPGALERDRVPIWKDTLALIRDYPLLGTGLGTYGWAIFRYQTHMLDSAYEHAHNDYLEFASDIGVPAAVLLFTALWLLVIKTAGAALGAERTRDAILAMSCAGAMTSVLIHEVAEFNLQMPGNALIFAWIAGTAASIVAHVRPRPEGGAPHSRSLAAVLGACLSAVAARFKGRGR